MEAFRANMQRRSQQNRITHIYHRPTQRIGEVQGNHFGARFECGFCNICNPGYDGESSSSQ
jgi:hypothetical protein